MDTGAQPLAVGTSSSSSPPGAARAVALTARQQAVYDLVRPLSEGGLGKTQPEAGAMLGISRSVVNKTMQVVYRKLGIKKGSGHGEGGKLATEHRKPEVAAAALEAAADPLSETRKAAIERVNEQLKAAGVPDKVSEALVRRLRVKYANGVFAARDLRTNEILEMLGKKIHLVAEFLDEKVVGEASARDLMLGMGVMLEKRNLLRGEPTAIISDHERKKLNELAPALLAEIRRRGLTVEGVVTEKTVEPA